MNTKSISVIGLIGGVIQTFVALIYFLGGNIIGTSMGYALRIFFILASIMLLIFFLLFGRGEGGGQGIRQAAVFGIIGGGLNFLSDLIAFLRAVFILALKGSISVYKGINLIYLLISIAGSSLLIVFFLKLLPMYKRSTLIKTGCIAGALGNLINLGISVFVLVFFNLLPYSVWGAVPPFIGDIIIKLIDFSDFFLRLLIVFFFISLMAGDKRDSVL